MTQLERTLMVGMSSLAIDANQNLQGNELGLCHNALEAAKFSFAPISGFAVGAVIKSIDGREFTGQNQENFGFDSIHAEMAALVNWNVAGEPKIDTIAIAGFKFWPDDERTIVVTPCGRCRQWLYEAAIRSESDPRIICTNANLSVIRIYRIQNLLPDAFSPESNMYKTWYTEMRRRLRRN